MKSLFKSSNDIVREIHSEIDSTQERLLAEARRIIAANGNFSDKAERLAKIGFTKVDAVVKHLAKRKVFVENEEQAKLIEYYMQNYPFQKFLTEQAFENICKKYNLIYAPIGNYKKDVPEKNIKDIEVATVLKKDDSPLDVLKCRLKYENFLFGGHTFLSMWYPVWWKLPRMIDGNYRSQYRVTDLINEKYKTGFEYVVNRIDNITINRQGLFIAAPEHHFDLKGLLKDGMLHSTFSVTTVKDPIVFRYVKGGIQVITKWGIEGEDKELVNEIMN